MPFENLSRYCVWLTKQR
uniref:Uncharacterized protein n=1 Tax=Anguilla anguilla TaxID=7936 RepID=A0A0E9XUD0_ANGAN